jgi:hypothetical protein
MGNTTRISTNCTEPRIGLLRAGTRGLSAPGPVSLWLARSRTWQNWWQAVPEKKLLEKPHEVWLALSQNGVSARGALHYTPSLEPQRRREMCACTFFNTARFRLPYRHLHDPNGCNSPRRTGSALPLPDGAHAQAGADGHGRGRSISVGCADLHVRLTAIEQGDHRIEVFAENGERHRGVGQNARVVTRHLDARRPKSIPFV